ncbi:MAG: amino-acid N-acetyltransferase [Gammaproteobacteria bacterium]|nr:amino-acid N-acetyltransferase [Gammaproteobacteria bacterium]
MFEKQEAVSFVRGMREASPYIRAHRDHVFVVHLGGEALVDARFPHLVQDLTLLHGIGVKLVLVHGARPQIDARLATANIASTWCRHIRVTDAAALAEVKLAVAAARITVEAQFSHATVNRPFGGTPLRIVGGNFVVARPAGVVDGIDLQFTGEVRKVDASAIRRLIDQDDLVLVSPLAYSPTGEVFSLNALDLATSIAADLKAAKLIVLCDGPGVAGPDGAVLRELTAQEAAALTLPEPLAQVMSCALEACNSGVGRVHLVPREVEGALLLELFTRDGVGTLVSSTPFDRLRPAGIEDVGGILDLIEPLEAEGILVKRSREKLEMEIDHFSVVERDDTVVACGALYPFAAAGMGEIACIAVHPEYRRNGFGDALLAALEQRAEDRGMSRVFALTTHTAHWFQEKGYSKVGLDDLPVERRELYNYRRNSIVLSKALGKA